MPSLLPRKASTNWKRDKKETGLWLLPINPNAKPSQTPTVDRLDLQLPSPPARPHAANNLYTLPYKQQQLKYMHQAFFSAPIQTIIDAAHNDQLEGIHFLSKPALIRKYLASSPAKPKGHMKRTKKGTRSTRPKPKKREKVAAEPPTETQEVDYRVVPPEGQEA